MIEHSPEQLSMDAANAKALGISYGQYMAMKRDGRVRLPDRAPKTRKSDKKPATGKLCKRCGSPIPADRYRSSYCSDWCSAETNREMSRAYQRKKYHENKNKGS